MRGNLKTAFEEIIREHQGVVFSIAYHFFQNSALAEEVAQDVFLELYRNLGRIESDTHLVYWLRKTTANRCVDHKRKAAYRSEIGLEQAKEPAAAAVQNGLLSQTVRRQLAALPQKQRAAVILRYQEDLQPAEIAAMLKIPVNTVKSHLQRALETLRERLEPRQRVGV